METISEKMTRIRAGEAVAVDEDFLSVALTDHPTEAVKMVTASNATKGKSDLPFVAWLCDFKPPSSLQYVRGPDGLLTAVALPS